MKLLSALFLSLFCLQAAAQSAEAPLDIHYYADSLHAALPKDNNGRYYTALKLPAQKDSRVFVYLMSTEFDVALMIETPSGKWLMGRGRKIEKEFYGKPSFSIATIDTSLDETGDYTIYMTSAAAGGKGKFMIQTAYGTKESLVANAGEVDFCNRLGFLMKHAQIGFRFLRVGSSPLTESGGGYYPTYYPVHMPLWFGDARQRIETCQYCDAYRYTTNVYTGSYSDARAKYNALKEQLKSCFGNAMEYLEKEGVTKYLTFSATIKGDDPIVKSWAAKRKDVQYEVVITLYGEPAWTYNAAVTLEMQNHYEPID